MNVSCNGFSYTTQQVLSCSCKPCAFKTVISGRAFGRSNGTEVPLKIGQIIVKGEVVSYTSMSGIFKFEVKKDTKRVVATFHDETFNLLADITKIIEVNSGSSTFATVVMPLTPTPIPFDTTNGTEIHMGGDGDGMPPAAQLSIPPNAIVTADGESFNGNVKASLHFMDPRKREDIESANGEFVSESPDGTRMPLKTFGMFQLDLHDDNGNALSTNKPLTFSLDSSMFNVPLNEDGSPDLALWSYDINKGIWIETGQLKEDVATDGRRKLLQSPNKYTFEFDHRSAPTLDPYTMSIKKVFTGTYTNCDHSVKIYEYVEEKTVKEGACVVAVSVYKDLSLIDPYTEQNIEITTYVQELDKSSYLGTSKTKIIKNGRACIPIFCDKLVYISVTRNGDETLYSGEHYLPIPNYVRNVSNNEIVFESRDFGASLRPSSTRYKPDTILEGPVFQLDKTYRCAHDLTSEDNSFQFKFAPFTKAPSHPPYDGPNNSRTSWYPVSPSMTTFRSCFMKVAFKVNP